MSADPKNRDAAERRGAGRPVGGPFGEPTQIMRVPASQVPKVVTYLDQFRRKRHGTDQSNVYYLGPAGGDLPVLPRPLYLSPAPQAGFPSPATDYVEEVIDLNKFLVDNPAATFFMRVQGDSMKDAGILDGAILTVNRSLRPRPGVVVVAVCDGDLLVKRLRKLKGELALVSENEEKRDNYPPIFLDKLQEYSFWGVVTGAIHKL